MQPRPAWVTGVADAVQVVTGESSTCIRTRDGRVLCWGENGYGQLGDGTTEASAKPREVRFCADSSEPVFPAAGDGVPLLAALQRDSCYGNCPVYSVRVYDDGTVIYRGDWHVRIRGGRKTRLRPTELDALRTAFRRSDFLGLAYRCRGGHTDASTARVFFTEGEKARLISHYHGCDGVPPELTKLEDEIDRIIGTRRWVGPPNDGPFDLGAMEGHLSVPGVAVEPDEDSASSVQPPKHPLR